MAKIKEKFKQIKDYEGLYEISNFGNVKSLAKEWIAGCGSICKKGETVLKMGLDGCGYNCVRLSKNGKTKTFKIYHLVWDHFGNNPRYGRMLQVDHKDENKLNCIIDNLQLLTPRQNTSKYHKTQKTSSKHTGVYWHKRGGKWRTQIQIGKKHIHLGYFIDEYEAHLAYQKALRAA